MKTNENSIYFDKNCLKLILKIQSLKSTKNIWKLYYNTINSFIEIKEIEIRIKDKIKEETYNFKNQVNLNDKQVTSFEIHLIDKSIFIKIISNKQLKNILILKNLTKIFFNRYLLLKQFQESKKLNIKDEITELYNQKYLREILNKEIEKANRYKQSFSVVFFDLDGLRLINEKYGHLIGTKTLMELAKLFVKHLRKSDIISRFGGDEFVFVLFNTKKEQAISVCNRLKNKIKNHTFLKKDNLKIKLTGSFGISVFPEHGNNAEELIKNADKAMYEIKKQGKNGIKLFGG